MRAASPVLILVACALGACTKQTHPPIGSAASEPAAAPSSRPAAASSASAVPDASSEESFTTSVLARFASSDPAGGWARKEALTLTNKRGLVVNLDRIWNACQARPAECAREAAHFVAASLKVAGRAGARATASSLIPVVRSKTYVDELPPEVRARVLFEPLVADLIVMYVVDSSESLRSAQATDLEASGVSREALPEVARNNVEAVLSRSGAQPRCSHEGVKVWATGSYFESSRLLLAATWTRLATEVAGPVIVTAPSTDKLVVACNRARATLAELASTTEKLWRSADRPLSRAMLEWSERGWTVLKP
jgi:uncharacterized protein YtpQ (UPF0354 family)